MLSRSNLGACCSECARTGGSCGGGVSGLGYERFDLTKYEDIYNPKPQPYAIDPQWDFLNQIMTGSGTAPISVEPGSVARRMYPQTLSAQAARDAEQAAEQAEQFNTYATWGLIAGAGLFAVLLLKGGR